MTDGRTVEHEQFTEVWHCDQPKTYRVLRQHWEYEGVERPVRHVYEVEAARSSS